MDRHVQTNFEKHRFLCVVLSKPFLMFVEGLLKSQNSSVPAVKQLEDCGTVCTKCYVIEFLKNIDYNERYSDRFPYIFHVFPSTRAFVSLMCTCVVTVALRTSTQ